MSPLSSLSILVAACALAACALARKERRRSAMTLLLALGLAADLARAALQALVLRPARAALGPDVPYRWPARGAFHIVTALELYWPLGLAGVAGAAFLRWSFWPSAVSWAAIASGFAVAYPWLRHDRLDVATGIVWGGALAGSARYAIASWKRNAPWGPEHWSVAWIWSIALAVAALVRWWPDPAEHWEIARRLQQVGYAALLCYQVSAITRRRRM